MTSVSAFAVLSALRCDAFGSATGDVSGVAAEGLFVTLIHLGERWQEENELGELELGELELGEFELGEFELGEFELGEFELGEFELGEFELGEFELGEFELGEFELGEFELGEFELGEFELGEFELGEFELGEFELGEFELGEFELGEFELGEFELGELEEILFVHRKSVRKSSNRHPAVGWRRAGIAGLAVRLKRTAPTIAPSCMLATVGLFVRVCGSIKLFAPMNDAMEDVAMCNDQSKQVS